MYKLVYVWNKRDGSKLIVTCYGFGHEIFKGVQTLVNDNVCDVEILWCLPLKFSFKNFKKCWRKEVSYCS